MGTSGSLCVVHILWTRISVPVSLWIRFLIDVSLTELNPSSVFPGLETFISQCLQTRLKRFSYS